MNTQSYPGRLKEEEIEAIIKDAEKNYSGDKKRKELIEIKNKEDTLIYSIALEHIVISARSRVRHISVES